MANRSQRSTAATQPEQVRELRSLAHRAVTEGVNLKYVELMRQALYRAADEIEKVAGESYEALLDAERRALDHQEFIAYTLDEFGDRMPSQWKAHARSHLGH